jgi:hypothetical protein
MSQENFIPFEAHQLTVEAATSLEDFDRLKVEHPQATEAIERALQDEHLNLEQIVSVLSRNGKQTLLDEISNRLETGVRALALTKANPEEKKATLASIVTEVSTIWEKRRD